MTSVSPSVFFNSSCGLQHGILYHLYCLWLSWKLSRMLFATMDKGFLLGFSVESRNNDELLASHLLFLDDI